MEARSSGEGIKFLKMKMSLFVRFFGATVAPLDSKYGFGSEHVRIGAE
jgi:hypothetical protein